MKKAKNKTCLYEDNQNVIYSFIVDDFDDLFNK